MVFDFNGRYWPLDALTRDQFAMKSAVTAGENGARVKASGGIEGKKMENEREAQASGETLQGYREKEEIHGQHALCNYPWALE